MRSHCARFIAGACAVVVVIATAASTVQAQGDKDLYPAMAARTMYMMADRDAEVALARSAAPRSISDSADVMVLGPEGYVGAVKGTNGFLCIVERSWGAGTDDPEFWNPKIRSPICFNPSARKSVVPIYLQKTRLALAGKSKSGIAGAVAASLDRKEVPNLESGAMCYMMSKHQYLSDRGKSWHPHLMFFVGGDASSSWGADLPGSPIMAANDPEERMTIMMVWVGHWSDGTPAPSMDH